MLTDTHVHFDGLMQAGDTIDAIVTRAAQAVGWGNVVVAGIPEKLWHRRPAGAGESIIAGTAMPPIKDITGVVRLYVTAGAGAPGDAFCGSVYALFEECEVGTEIPAVRVASSPVPYLPRPGGWKSGNYWQNVDALALARSIGVEDVLLFNQAAQL